MYNWTLQESVIKTLYMILCKDGEKLVFKLLVLGVTERYLRECSYNFSPGIFIGNHVFHYDQWFDLTIPIIHPYNLKNENEVGTVSKLTLLCSVIGIDSLEFSSPQKKKTVTSRVLDKRVRSLSDRNLVELIEQCLAFSEQRNRVQVIALNA